MEIALRSGYALSWLTTHYKLSLHTYRGKNPSKCRPFESHKIKAQRRINPTAIKSHKARTQWRSCWTIENSGSLWAVPRQHNNNGYLCLSRLHRQIAKRIRFAGQKDSDENISGKILNYCFSGLVNSGRVNWPDKGFKVFTASQRGRFVLRRRSSFMCIT